MIPDLRPIVAQEYLAEVVTVKFLTLDVVELIVTLIAPDDMLYLAGQYMELKVSGIYHPIPIAQPPTENNKIITLCTRLTAHDQVYQFVKTLEPDAQIRLRGPAGDFTITSTDANIFCIAENQGVVPFASIIPDLLVRGFRGSIKLLFEVRTEDNVFYFGRFKYLATRYENFKFTPIVARPYSHWPGEVGTIATYLQVSAQQFSDYHFYVAGNKTMVDTVVQILKKEAVGLHGIKTFEME